jgi:hypothetical protein
VRKLKYEPILVSSITYAIKGRDLLRSMGMKAYIERSKGQLEHGGCGYQIYVDGDFLRAKQILRDHHVRILDEARGGYG